MLANGDGTVSAVAALAAPLKVAAPPKRAAPKNRASQAGNAPAVDVAKDDNDDDQFADKKTTVALEAQPQPSGASLASIAVDGLPSAISTRLSEKSTPATTFTAPSGEYQFLLLSLQDLQKAVRCQFYWQKERGHHQKSSEVQGVQPA